MNLGSRNLISRACLVLGTLLLVVPAYSFQAHDDDGEQREGRREGRRGGGRGGWGEGRGEGWGGGRRDRGMGRMVDRIAERLELDEEQRAVLEDLTAEQRERMNAMRQTFRAIREAEEAGDVETAEFLRAGLPERGEGWRNRMAPLLEGLEPVLREDQLGALEAMRNEPRGPAARFARMGDELELDDDQRARFRELAEGLGERFRSQREQWRALRPKYDELREARSAGNDERAAELEQEIEGMRPNPGGIFDGFFEDAKTFLNDDQIAQLEEMRARQRAERGERRGRDRQREGRPPDRLGERDEGQNTAQILSRLEEALDFGGQLELDERQRVSLQKAIEDARKQLEANDADQERIVEGVFKAMRADLREDQIKSFGSLKASVVSGTTSVASAGDIRLVLRAVRKVRLRTDQKRKLRDIHKAGAAEFKKVRNDKAEAAKLADEVKRQIVEMLNDRQIRTFERELERQTRRARRAQRT